MKRESSHVHFIQAMKGGLVVKILSTHRRPAVRFKELKAICESEDAKNSSPCSTFKKQEDVGLPYADRTVSNETHTMGGRTAEYEPEIYDLDKDDGDSDSDGKANSSWDELSFSAMTLKELKKRCTTKKRKHSEADDLKQGTANCALGAISSRGQDDAVQLKEDDDLDEPLSVLKSKLSKKLKTKGKTSKTTVPIEALMEKNSSSQSDAGELGPINIKTEILEDGGLDSQNVSATDAFAPGYSVEMSSCRECLDEVPERINRKDSEMEASTFGTEAISCSVNEISYEYMGCDEFSIASSVTEKCGESKVDILATTIHESLPSFVSELLNEGNTNHSLPSYSPPEAIPVTNDMGHEIEPDSDEPLPSFVAEHLDEGNIIRSPSPEAILVTSDISYEIRPNNTIDSIQLEETSCHMDSTMIQIHDMAIIDSLESVVLNQGKNADICKKDGEDGNKEVDEKIPCHMDSIMIQMQDMAISDSLQCTELNQGGKPDICNEDGEGGRKEAARAVCKPHGLDSNTEAHIPDIELADTLQCLESSNGGNVSGFSVDYEADIQRDSFLPNFSPQNNYPCSRPENGSGFWDGSSPATGQEKSSSITSGLTYVKQKCSLGTDSPYASDWLKDVEEHKSHHGAKIGTPKRIFSTRKVFSPTSQEKLLQAVDSEELYANIESSSCKSKDSSVGSDLEEAEVAINRKRKIKILKNDKDGSPLGGTLRSILKDPSVSSATPVNGSGSSSSVYSCAQKAIKFSQMQMHDIETLAMKLTKELKSMTDIVEETLESEVCLSTSSKYTTDEIRTALDNAAGVQETTRKWLSIMSKDCNRFCKIMKSAEKKGARASHHSVQKERKKIIFADEAGGKLCHVKFFDDPYASPLVSECQKDDYQPFML